MAPLLFVDWSLSAGPSRVLTPCPSLTLQQAASVMEKASVTLKGTRSGATRAILSLAVSSAHHLGYRPCARSEPGDVPSGRLGVALAGTHGNSRSSVPVESQARFPDDADKGLESDEEEASQMIV